MYRQTCDKTGQCIRNHQGQRTSRAANIKGNSPESNIMKIKLRFSSCDGGRWSKTVKSIAGARKAIIHQIGQPEIGSTYAISGDGICKVEVSGDASLNELFPQL